MSKARERSWTATQVGAFTSVGDLEAAILAYVAETNADPKPFVWTKTADEILDSVRRFCQRTTDASKRQETSNSEPVNLSIGMGRIPFGLLAGYRARRHGRHGERDA